MNQFGGGNEGQIDNYFQQQAAQQSAINQYNQQSQQAVSGLQQQKSGLADQYGSLLQTVTGQYQPLINQTTATTGEALARRGISPDSQYYQQQTQGALQPVYGAEAANTQAIGQGSINDTNTLAQAIAGIQQGNAQFGANLPLEYGSLQLQQNLLPSQIALNQSQSNLYGAQAANLPAALANALKIAQLGVQYQNIAPGNTLFNTNSQSYFNPATGQFGKI